MRTADKKQKEEQNLGISNKNHQVEISESAKQMADYVIENNIISDEMLKIKADAI